MTYEPIPFPLPAALQSSFGATFPETLWEVAAKATATQLSGNS
ncbi:MAG: hypothetical protein QMC73_06145 [Myxococcota bacterium]